MKKKIFLALAVMTMLVCIFAISVNAATVKFNGQEYEVTTYTDVVAKTKIDVTNTEDVVIFADGFCCPTAYVFKDQDYVNGHNNNHGDGKYAFDFTYINGKTNKEYTFGDILKVDIPQGVVKIGHRAFQDVTTLVEVSIPSSVTTIEGCTFEKATGLKRCTFEHRENDGLTYLSDWMFSECSSLEALSIPDCVTKIEGKCFARNCTNLTAVYLSKNLVTFTNTDSNSNNAPFRNNTNMYLVNEPFAYDSIPEKPEVYYFPSGLSSENMVNNYFGYCSNLNKVLVFGESVTAMPCNHSFEKSGNETIVFLGDMTKVSATSNWPWSTKNIYFANVNDKSAEDVETLSFNSSTQSVFFCHAEGNTIHLVDPRQSVTIKESNCVDNEWKNAYCFCGAYMGEVEIPNSNNGGKHDLENATVVSITYTDFDKVGIKTFKCEKCGVANITEEAPALFTCLGYSSSESENSGIVVGFSTNNKAVSEYKEATGNTLNYGVFAVSQVMLGDKEIFGEDGKATSGVITSDVITHGFIMFDIKIVGFTDAQKDMNLAMGAYVAVTDGETTTYSYMQDDQKGEKIGDYFFVSYNIIVGKPTTDADAQ